MTADFKEQVSALLDGELEPNAADRTVSRLVNEDSEALECFGRYRLIGDVMRGETGAMPGSVAAAVSAALQDEPTVLAPRRPASRWLKPAAGMALAASVAVVAVMVAPRFLQPSGLPEQPTVVTAAAPAQTLSALPVETLPVATVRSGESGTLVSAPAGPRWQTLDEQFGAQLNRLVIEHHEFGGRTGINGPVAHIGLVNYAGR
jgi:sigma-E factor negative regulatory protein RseA